MSITIAIPSTHPIVVQKFSEALKSMSVVVTWQPLENDDPNPAMGMARNSQTITTSKPGKHSRKPLVVHFEEDLALSCTTNLKDGCLEATLYHQGLKPTSFIPKETIILLKVLADGASNILEHGNLVEKACDRF